jgi:hypothetical protein
MTDAEIAAANALAKLHYYPGSFDEKFSQSMRDAARKNPFKPLSKKQKNVLWEMVLRYRKKIQDTKLIQKSQKQIFGHYQENLFD